jgi:hypothetical protein
MCDSFKKKDNFGKFKDKDNIGNGYHNNKPACQPDTAVTITRHSLSIKPDGMNPVKLIKLL